MKKLIAALLALTMVCSFAGCAANDPTEAPTETPTEAPTQAPTEAPTQAPSAFSGSLEELVDAIYEKAPIDMMVMTTNLIENPGEENYLFTSCTGLNDLALVSDAVVSESMIGSIAYSLVLVKVPDAANAQSVGESMKSGIDPRKWICVEADDLMVCGKGDVVMLVMMDSSFAEEGLSSQNLVDGFSAVMGGTDFILK